MAIVHSIPSGHTPQGSAAPDPDPAPVQLGPSRPTYAQDWPAYNAAQVHEGDYFLSLLRELTELVEPPDYNFGRPRLPLSDVLFGIGLKIYSMMSGRRAMSDFRNAHDRGLLAKIPSFTSVFRYMEDPAITPKLRFLITQSALPLSSVETGFAPDSTGFSSSVYDRWFEYKHGKKVDKKTNRWVKLHIETGVMTNIVTDADATADDSADSPYFKPFLQQTAANFDIDEVYADKAYLSRNNLRAVEGVGGKAYIPFKSNSLARPRRYKSPDTTWERAFYFFNFHRDEFYEYYHQRSNVETTFHMIKAKFGSAVRAKTKVAQVNEVLAKVLCHNVCVLIQSFFELGIESHFAPAAVAGRPDGMPGVAPAPVTDWNWAGLDWKGR